MKNFQFLRLTLCLCAFATLCLSSAFSLELQNGVASNITRVSADFYCHVIATNGSGTNPVLTVFYGNTDFTTNASSWSYSNVYGQAGIGIIVTNISGLTPAKLHYYRWQAIEGSNIAWAPATSNFWTLAGAPTNMPTGVYQTLMTDSAGNLTTPSQFFSANFSLMTNAGIASSSQITNLESQINIVSQQLNVAEANIATNADNIASNSSQITTVSQRVDIAEGNITTNAANLSAHTAATNPHSITPALIGAASTAELAAVQGNLNTVSQQLNIAEGNITTNAVNLATHTAATNPHSITPALIGAASTDELATVQGNLNTVSNQFTAHATNDANPHAVTAAQAGAVPTNDTSYLSILSSMTNFVPDSASSNYLVYDPATRTLSGCVTNLGSGGSSGGTTNQIMDVNGVLYTITNTPTAGQVIKCDPATSNAWFADDNNSGGGTYTNIFTGFDTTGAVTSASGETNKVLRGTGWEAMNIDFTDDVTTNWIMSWSSITGMPQAMVAGAAVSFNDKIYAFGGTYDTASSNMYVYDGTNWSSSTYLPDVTRCCRVDVFSNKIYTFRGQNTGNMWFYDGTNWSSAPDYPGGDIDGWNTLITFGDYLYASCQGKRTNIWRFNGSTWGEVEGLPCSYGNTLTIFSNQIYSVGGYEQTNVYAYNGTNWLSQPGLPFQYNFHNAFTNSEGKLITLGGEPGWSSINTDVLEFDGVTWKTNSDLTPFNRFDPNVTWHQGKVYVLGGSPALNWTGSTNVDCITMTFDPITNFSASVKSPVIFVPQSDAPVATNMGGFYVDNAGTWYRCTNGTTWSSF